MAALFVRLEPGLDHSRREGIFAAIKHLPGVELVCDLGVISPETLCDALLIERPRPVPRDGPRFIQDGLGW